MSVVVVVNPQDWKRKGDFQPGEIINWVLPPELFVESDQDFNYGLAMIDYFDPAILYATDSTGTNLANYWFALNNGNAYPANNGIMKTPVAWFADKVRFATDASTGWTQTDIGKGGGIFWILAAFASVAALNQRKGTT